MPGTVVGISFILGACLFFLSAGGSIEAGHAGLSFFAGTIGALSALGGILFLIL